jgi:hypothetical protein
MSDSEPEYAVDDQDEIESEAEEEEYDLEEDEYAEAIENYARMLREVPQAKLDGIVEQVEEVFNNAIAIQQFENDETSVYLLVLTLFVLITSAIVRGFLDSKRINMDYIP